MATRESKRRGPQFVDWTGHRFTRLVATEYLGDEKWRCKCDCGRESVAQAYYLSIGRVKSCGCLKAERWTKHGCYGKEHFHLWNGIKQRCLNPKQRFYSNYGGRGITLCQEWADSYDAFAKAIGPRPSPKHSLDRINNNGNYEPGNVRWATSSEQCSNRRTNRYVRYRGQVYTVSQLARLIAAECEEIDASLFTSALYVALNKK